MRELERQRQGDEGYWAERDSIREELDAGGDEGDEKSPRKATREAKSKVSRRRRRLIFVVCAALLGFGLFLV
ncbi:MAG: hypothetical protein H0X71_06595, partial [Rubrobacter sp.]|nr:hypothetical protein [Rubrobacter sp.]